VFNEWKNSTGMHANCHCAYLQKLEWGLSDAETIDLFLLQLSSQNCL